MGCDSPFGSAFYAEPDHQPAPAEVSAAPTSRDSHAEDPAGAPIPTTSEPTCDTCHQLLSCVGTRPKGCPQ